MGDALGKAADLWGSTEYLTFGPTGERLTFEKLHHRSNRVANALADIGVEKGDRVGLYLTNSPQFVVSIFACSKLGAVETPINWMYREREVIHAVESAGIKTIFVEPIDDIVEVLKSATSDFEQINRIVMTKAYRFDEISNLDGVDVSLLSNLTDGVSENTPTEDREPEDPAAIMYTSGTTGLPKPTVLSNESLILAAKSVLGAQLPDDNVNYNPYPLFHLNNQCYSMLASLLEKSGYVLSDRFSVSTFWDEVTENDVTSFNIIGGVPKILHSTYSSEEVPENELQYALGPISAELWEPFEETFDLTVIQAYSQTESPTLLLNYTDPDQIKVGSIGKPMFPDLGHEAWIESDGERQPPGTQGELVRTDPASMIGYRDLPERTKETLRDGKTYSGDIARVDEDGYFYYIDRKKFMVRRGGENISAQEIENVIEEHADIEESAVIPVPDSIRGEEVKAVVKRRIDDLTEREIVLQVARSLASFKVPRYVEFVTEFPKTPTERIQRVTLAEEEKQRSDYGWDRDAEYPDWEDEI